MKYRPFKSYLGRPLNLPTGNAWYEEDILNAERQFVKQFESPSAEIKVHQGELYRWVKASERLPEDGSINIAKDKDGEICKMGFKKFKHGWNWHYLNGNHITENVCMKGHVIEWLEKVEANQEGLYDKLLKHFKAFPNKAYLPEQLAGSTYDFITREYHLIRKISD